MKAPAKINLTLRILSKRADGYHEISSLMRAIRLCDEVEITLRTGGSEGLAPPVLSIRSDTESVPEGSGNIAYRAAELMTGMYPGRCSHIDIELKKNIPVTAGLAGGSADAAAVLLGLAKELAPEAALADVASWGAKLGMDVPFCVYTCAAANPALGYKGAGAALAERAGDALTIIAAPEKAWIVLVAPPVEVPTKQVYELFDIWKGPVSDSDNDLEAPCADAWPVVAESLIKLKTICADEGACDVKVQLSGSGPAVFAYFYEPQKALAERVCARAKTVFRGVPVYFTDTL